MTRRWPFVLLLLLGIAAIGLWAARVPLSSALYARLVEGRAGRNVTASLPDGLHVLLCGTGSPLPDPTRAGPCALIIAGTQMVLIDAGEGSARSIAMAGVSLAGLDALFLTHLHSDHIDGLGPVMLQRWVGAAATTPLPIHGAGNLAPVIAGFNAAYAPDHGYRTAHHGAAIAPPSGAGAVARPFAVPGATPVSVYSQAGLTIAAFAVDHSPVEPAVGYVIRYKGRSLVISGDTAPTPAVAAAARGTDLLIHEALQPALVQHLTAALEKQGQPRTAQITRDILDYHTSPEAAADAATAAGVGTLVLTHIVPPLPSRLFNPAFLGAAPARFSGRIIVGKDGLLLSLPAGSTAITTKDLM